LWRDRDTLQLGVDPRRARALTGLGKAAGVVSLLDGSRDTIEVVRTAAEYGIPEQDVDRVIGLLATAGMLEDFPADTRAFLPDYLRGRLGPEMACAALAHCLADGGAGVLARRRAAFVRIHGAGRVGACIATFLAASGVAWVSCLDNGMAEAADVAPAGLGVDDIGASRAGGVAQAVHRIAPEVRTANDARRQPDLVVIAGWPDPVLVAALMRDRVPHLIVRADEAIGVVGPFVLPSRSACARCLDLSKANRDPAWPRILAQASAGELPAATQACDTVLTAATAALASAQALTFVDRSGAPAAANGTLELALPEWQWQRRGWPPHPACTCGAALLLRPQDVRATVLRAEDVGAAFFLPEDVGAAFFGAEDVGAARLLPEDVGAAFFLAEGVEVSRVVGHDTRLLRPEANSLPCGGESVDLLVFLVFAGLVSAVL
jgi:bacteriocin biosynthesis cyclodehydratase domain-containing protein